MKNKFSLLTLFTLLLSSQLFLAQNTLPSTGKVGIGTTNPTTELEVVGRTKLGRVNITDTLTVERPVNLKDSLTVDKKLTVKQDVKIIGKTVMTDNVRAKSNLTVLGNTRTKGNEVVEGNTKILGTTKMMGNGFVLGNFKFKGLADPSLTDNRWLMIRPNGKVESMNKSRFLAEMYQEPCKYDPLTGTNASPIWASLPGILWTGSTCAPAKVGIGTDNPLATLHVEGTGYFNGRLGLGTLPSPSAKLTIEEPSSTRGGILINLTSATQTATSGTGIKLITNNSLRKAFLIVDGSVNNDVFQVNGNGTTSIRNQAIGLKSFSVTNSSNNDVFRIMGDGSVWATKVNVALHGDFPDYVFSKEYKLMPLLDLETFILEKHHLPNMPTAEQVKENGLDVGKINTVLVEKVEELTLYTIEQQKSIEDLKKELELLKELINSKR